MSSGTSNNLTPSVCGTKKQILNGNSEVLKRVRVFLGLGRIEITRKPFP